MKPERLLERIARGELANVDFADAQHLVEALGFTLDRVQGSHHIYRHAGIKERLNLQPHGGKAKPYQLRQIRQMMERNNLQLGEETK